MTEPAAPLRPGSTIGILGGGQLGRMLSVAASRLGYRCHIYCPDPESPAFDVSAAQTVAAYDDRDALDAFAAAVDVVTYEFENVPVDSAFRLDRLVPVRPSPSSLYMAMDRLHERIFLTDNGIPCAPFAAIEGPACIPPALERVGSPAILKTRRFGYDGKGQTTVRAPEEAESAWAAIGGQRAMLEGFVRFEREISVVVARGMDGALAPYPPVWNVHENHILKTTRAPAPIPDDLAAEAQALACRIVEAVGHVGVMGVEMFVVTGDRGASLVINEMAPRVHNSGHWTMDGAVTDQFEQHIRAIAGLPLGAADMVAPRVEMTNLIGADADDLPALAAIRGDRIHLYGKAESRPGRKMGHVNRFGWSTGE